MTPYWHDWKHRLRDDLIARGLSPPAARLAAEMEAQARSGVECHVGRAAALAAEFIPGEVPGTGTLMIDSLLVSPERRTVAKVALGLPADF